MRIFGLIVVLGFVMLAAGCGGPTEKKLSAEDRALLEKYQALPASTKAALGEPLLSGYKVSAVNTDILSATALQAAVRLGAARVESENAELLISTRPAKRLDADQWLLVTDRLGNTLVCEALAAHDQVGAINAINGLGHTLATERNRAIIARAKEGKRK